MKRVDNRWMDAWAHAEHVGQRATVVGGDLYLARDLRVSVGGKTLVFPQHAVVMEFGHTDWGYDRLVWVNHKEGGRMTPLIKGYAGEG